MREFGNERNGTASVLCTRKGCIKNHVIETMTSEIAVVSAAAHDGNGHEGVAAHLPLSSEQAKEVAKLTGVNLLNMPAPVYICS